MNKGHFESRSRPLNTFHISSRINQCALKVLVSDVLTVLDIYPSYLGPVPIGSNNIRGNTSPVRTFTI